jgi:hypothetical protein
MGGRGPAMHKRLLLAVAGSMALAAAGCGTLTNTAPTTSSTPPAQTSGNNGSGNSGNSGSSLTTSQQNAVASAKNYLSMCQGRLRIDPVVPVEN